MADDDIEVWAVRHGPTLWSGQGRHTGRTDVPLTDDGEAEAVAIKWRLDAVDFDVRLVSPLERARRTAELAGVTGADVEPLVREWDYGDAEGLTRAEMRDRLGDPAWTVWSGTMPGGESLAEVAARADAVAALLRERTRQRALVVAHGHFLRVLAVRWCGLDPALAEHLELDPARICVLASDRGTPTVRAWNS